ncbi:MAG: hypothetical protein KDC87_07825 [Planctomycetes bacterium]|nr:hypothetical protein [Planctomycetota bacterium]MCB9870017.1 hypothetical protein [Planctomycetota bacterium]
MTTPRIHAVLTGDLVQSRRLSAGDLEKVRGALLAALEQVRGWRRGVVRGKPEFFRGDAWQVLLGDAGAALRVAVFVRAALRSFGVADTRIAVGLGEVEAVSTRRVSLSTGEAFVLSGHALDGMTGASRLAIQLPESSGPWATWMTAVGELCDSHVGRWTRRQAEIVSLAVGPDEPLHEQIAARVRPAVSRQAVSKALLGAGFTALRDAVRAFAETPWEGLLTRSAAEQTKKVASKYAT